MYYTYVVKSLSTGGLYIGSTQDIEKRLKRHNSGCTRSLKNKGPFILIHKEVFQTRQEAYKRERIIKSYKSGEAFKKLISS